MPELPGPRLLGRGIPEMALGAVYRRSRQLAKLRDALASTLEPEMTAHLVGVSWDGARLVVFTDSGAWATRLRYKTPQLEKAAQAHTGRDVRLSFRILPGSGAPRVAPRRPLSPAVCSVLESAARTIRDSELAGALRRLARQK